MENLIQMNEKNSIKREELRILIKEKGCILKSEEGFELASGGISKVFFDIKPLLLDPKGVNLVAELLYEKIKGFDARYVGGLESGAIPIVTALCMLSQRKEKQFYGFFVRKKPKGRGTNKWIEGNFSPSENVIVLDDVTTQGNSICRAIDKVIEHGGKVIAAVTIIDRLEGAKEKLRKRNLELISLFTKDDFKDEIE